MPTQDTTLVSIAPISILKDKNFTYIDERCFLAHICDSESGTWYKFNDESVEKIEGKKLKLGNEDEYEGKDSSFLT